MSAWEPDWAHILSENPVLRDGEAIEPPVAGVGRNGDMGYVPVHRTTDPQCGTVEPITGCRCDLKTGHNDRHAYRDPDFAITWPRESYP